MKQRNDTKVMYGLISIFVFLLLSLSLLFSAPIGSESKRVFVTISGSSADDLFGHNVSGIGDFNGDGYDDIIVGAPGVNSKRGNAYIFFGGSWFNGSLSADSANVTINGSVTGDLFGWDVSDAGNVNNDNYDDVIIGAPGNNGEAGAAYIFLGGISPPSYLNANDADVILNGESSGDQFGFSVSSAGDVNNDDLDDVLVGAPGTDIHSGAAYIFFGNDPMNSLINSLEANTSMFGENTQDRFGHSISDAGDVNDDNFEDVIIGAPGADRSYIFFGGDPMNKWVQTTQGDFDSSDRKVHVNIPGSGEVKLEDFNGIKAMMSYNGSGSNIPRIRTWDQTIWGGWSDSSTPDSDDNYWFDMESGTVRKNEKILGIQDSGFDLNLQVWNGSSWGPVLEEVDVAVNPPYRSFDIAYETRSGDAIVAYLDANSGDLFPKYRIWNGTSWSPELDTLEEGTGPVCWIVLASNPKSDEILMVTLDWNNDIWAQVWDGDAWGNNISIEVNAPDNAYQCFDVAYESQTGYGFICWADNSFNLKYRRWKGNWTEPESSWGLSPGITRFVKLATEPNSDYILAARLDVSSEIAAGVWDGSSWGSTKVVTPSPKINTRACFDVAWESKGDREGIIVYGIPNDTPMYRNVTGNEINDTELSALDPNPDLGDPNWIVLESDPQSFDIMMMYMVNDPFNIDDIGVEMWNGSDWIKDQNVETESKTTNGRRFDLAYTDTSGYFKSQYYDAQITSPWGRIMWNADAPNETSLQIRTRTSPNGINWSSWSNWYTNGDRITSPANRWIQYQAWFETANISLTPTLYDITIELSHADLIINGTPGDYFGWSVSNAGDLDQDDFDDVIIGAPQNNSASGSSYIFHGNFITTESANDRYIDLINGDFPNVTLIGENPGDLFGYSVSLAGNFSSDGICDVIVGAPGASSNGIIHIFFGGPWMSSSIQAMNSNHTQMGESTNDYFGWSVSWAGNVDGDLLGFEENIVGSPFIDDGGTDSGKVYLIHLFYQPDLLINGNENDVYMNIPSGTQVNLTFLDAGTNISWVIILQNDGELEDTYQFTISENMLLDWSWELREDGSWRMITNGDTINLAMGEQKTFTLNISLPQTAVHGDESWVEITVTSQNDTQKKDSVRAHARAFDITKPEIMNTTSGTPATGGSFNITATVTDNILLDSVYLYYWFDLYPAGIDGPYNVTMNPGFLKEINVPINGLTLHYNISAKDRSGNWNETYEISIDIIDNDLPTILDTTVGIPIADNIFTISAIVNDNIEVDDVFLTYWFDLLGGGIEGPYNESMDPGYQKTVNIPPDALTLSYYFSANDTSDNWHQTMEYTQDVHEIVLPKISDTTTGLPNTGDQFIISAYVTDNFAVDSVHVYLWFTTTGPPTAFQNFTMYDMVPGNFNYQIDVPINALQLHYNISANDTSNNWNESGMQILGVLDGILPEISGISSKPTSQVVGAQVNITASIADNIEINKVGVNIRLINGSWWNSTMNHATGSKWYLITTFYDIGLYNFTIWVIDTTGNLNQSEVFNFTMMPIPPTVDYIQIRTEPNDGGEQIGSITFGMDEKDEYFASAYNNTVGYLWNVVANWYSTNIAAATVSPAIGYSTNFTAVGLGSGILFVTYGLYNASAQFNVVLKQEPEIKGKIPDITLLEDSPPYPLDLKNYAWDLQDTLSKLKWFLTGVDSSVINLLGENQTGNHVIYFVPIKNMFSNMLVTYWLEDSDGNKASQYAWVNVTPVNDPPGFNDCPDELYVHFDHPYRFDYTPYIYDIDDMMSELFLTFDDTSHLSANGFVITYLYPESMLGDKVFVTLSVSDGQGSGSKLIRITITSNYPPEFTRRLPDVILDENETLTAAFDLDEYITDLDGDPIEMSHTPSKVIITVNGDHTVDFSASGEWSGTERVTFRATDPMGAIAEQTINVTVHPVNDPPVIKSLPILKVHHDRPYIFDLIWYISDSDNDINDLIIYTSIPDYVTVNGTVLNLTFPKIYNGQDIPYSVQMRVYVFDGIEETSQETTVMVSDNIPPMLKKSINDQVMFEDENLTDAFDLDNHFLDFDGDFLTYTSGSDMITVIIHGNNSVDLITPPNWFGKELITLRAIDNKGAFCEETILVTVIPVNDAPEIKPIPKLVGEKGKEWYFDLSEYILDIDNEPGELIVNVSSPYVEVRGFWLVFNYPNNMTKDTLLIIVSDGQLETNFTVEVIIESPTNVPNIGAWLFSIPPLILIIAILVLLLIRRGIYILEDLFLITKSGLLIEHAGTSRDYEKGDDKDEDILAGMFVAVQEFIRDSFGGEEEHLKRLDYGDKTVLIYRGNHIILAAFLTGAITKPFYRKMKMFVEDVEEHYEGEVEDWSGDIADLPEIEIKLHSLLEGRYPRNNRKNHQYIQDELGEDLEEDDEEKGY